MPLTELEFKLPDYHDLSPQVAARFEKIRSRPVILSVKDLEKSFGPTNDRHCVFSDISLLKDGLDTFHFVLMIKSPKTSV